MNAKPEDVKVNITVSLKALRAVQGAARSRADELRRKAGKVVDEGLRSLMQGNAIALVALVDEIEAAIEEAQL